MLINGINVELTYSCLNKIYETLKEDDYSTGLKRYVSKNCYTINGIGI